MDNREAIEVFVFYSLNGSKKIKSACILAIHALRSDSKRRELIENQKKIVAISEIVDKDLVWTAKEVLKALEECQVY